MSLPLVWIQYKLAQLRSASCLPKDYKTEMYTCNFNTNGWIYACGRLAPLYENKSRRHRPTSVACSPIKDCRRMPVPYVFESNHSRNECYRINPTFYFLITNDKNKIDGNSLAYKTCLCNSSSTGHQVWSVLTRQQKWPVVSLPIQPRLSHLSIAALDHWPLFGGQTTQGAVIVSESDHTGSGYCPEVMSCCRRNVASLVLLNHY